MVKSATMIESMEEVIWRDGHNGNALMRDGHQGDRSDSEENARIASLRQSLKKFLVFQYLSRWGRELQRGR